MKSLFTYILICLSLLSFGQKVKVEWVSGDITVYKKGTTLTTKVKKNEYLEPTDRLFLGDKSLLLVSDASKKLYEINKKGYVTGKELNDALEGVKDNEYQRYLNYILKELKSHEGKMSANEKGIPGAPSRGNEFTMLLPDTMNLFSYEQLPLRWVNGSNTELVNIQLLTDKKNVLLDLDVTGDQFWFNNISTYFLIKKTLTLLVYERRFDGSKVLVSKVVVKQSSIDEAKTKKQFEQEFSEIQDERLNQIATALKWELNDYQLKALEIYKILMLDYPDDEMVYTSFVAFTSRTGLK